MSAVHFDSYTEARSHLKALLDAAERGQVATVRRDTARTAVVNVERLRHYLVAVSPSHAEVVPEAGGWSVLIPGLPVAADGASFAEAAFWACVRGGTAPDRGVPVPSERALPADLVHLLISKVGLPEAEVAEMTREEAVDRLNRYWTAGG